MKTPEHIEERTYFVTGKHTLNCQRCGKTVDIYISNGQEFIKKQKQRFVDKHRNCK